MVGGRVAPVAGRRRYWRTELIALAAGLVWSIGLLILAVSWPAYDSSSSESAQTSSGDVTTDPSSSATLLEVNGPTVLLVTGAPLLITVVLASLLWMRGVDRGPGVLAWTLVGLLGAATMASLLTIGPALLPVTAALITACAVRQDRRGPALRPAS